MARTDFTRTSVQVEQSIADLVDSIDRSLDSSSGDAERKGHFVISAFLSVLAVFASILGIERLVGKPVHSEATPADAIASVGDGHGASSREIVMVRQYVERARSQVQLVRETKGRIAPSMQIDGNLDVIDNALVDIAALLETDVE